MKYQSSSKSESETEKLRLLSSKSELKSALLNKSTTRLRVEGLKG